jgi:hypothetical protein
MHAKITLLAIFVIIMATALVTAGSITASTLAVKKKSAGTTKKSAGTTKKSAGTTKKSAGSKKTKSPTPTGTSSSATAGTGNSTSGGISSIGVGTDKFSKFITCMKLLSGPITRSGVDQCYNIVYATSGASSVIGSPAYAGPTSRATPRTSNIGPSSNSSTALGTP